MRSILATFTVVTFVHLEEHEVSVQYVFPGVRDEKSRKVQLEITDDFNEDQEPGDFVTWDDLRADFSIEFHVYRAHEVQTASRREVRNRNERIERLAMTPAEKELQREVLRKETEVEEGR